jgi:ketosteroid isomerase-like protein
MGQYRLRSGGGQVRDWVSGPIFWGFLAFEAHRRRYNSPMAPCSAKCFAILLAPALAVLVACTPEASRETVERELLEADLAFLQATTEDGLEGWLSFFTDDALRVDLQGKTVVGLEAIRAADAALFEPGGPRLRWEPAEAFAFTTGRGGVTRGRYTLTLDASAEDTAPDIISSGTYLTLWRRVDGRFKVCLDTSAADPSPEALLD